MKRPTVLWLMLCLIAVAGAASAQDKPSHAFFTTSDGVKIHYMIKGKGTPVILIHGYTGSAEGNWFSNGIADALARNHMVVALDCRNHGRSDKPEPGGPGRAQDVIELMDHLKIRRPTSWLIDGGGIVGRILALSGSVIRLPSAVRESRVDPEWRAKLPPTNRDALHRG